MVALVGAPHYAAVVAVFGVFSMLCYKAGETAMAECVQLRKTHGF